MPSRQRKQHPRQVGRGPVEEGSGAGRGGRHGKGRGTPGVEELGGAPSGIHFLTFVVSVKTDPGSGCGCFFKSLPRQLGLQRPRSSRSSQPRTRGPTHGLSVCPHSGAPLEELLQGVGRQGRDLPSPSPAPRSCSLEWGPFSALSLGRRTARG